MCGGKLRHKCFKLALNIYNIYNIVIETCVFIFIAPDIYYLIRLCLLLRSQV